MAKLPLLPWDIYEISTEKTEIHGIMLRGRIRKFAVQIGFNVLCENAADTTNCVRFAVPAGEAIAELSDYLQQIINDVHIEPVLSNITNPVLSKLKVDQEERYSLYS